MPDLKLYTIQDLREWLINNNPPAGLNEHVIAPARAFAIIHNPYVKDTDPVVAVIYEGEELAAYTSAIPEEINGVRYWWFSGLWCNPAYRGRGYGLALIGSLAEEYGVEYCLDRWGAPDVVEIFSFLGHKTLNTPRYALGNKLNRQTCKGKALYALYCAERWMRSQIATHDRSVYSLSYVTHIDDETYAFIVAHRNKDIFLHSQQMLNWERQHSVTLSCPLLNHVATSCVFAPAEVHRSDMYMVQVYDDKLVGFYMLKHNNDSLHVLFAYYDQEAKHKVFASIRDHVERLGVSQCITDNQDLAVYLKTQCGFRKIKESQVSFSYPKTLTIPAGFTMQNGDGDNFTVV